MSIQRYIEKMKDIQMQLLEYLDNDTNDEENYHNLFIILTDYNIRDDKYELKTILYLLSNIIQHHHRPPHFFDKIEKVLVDFENDLTKYFSNEELFNIFKGNKRILSFLIKSKSIQLTERIVKEMTEGKFLNLSYPQFFSREIKNFLKNEKNNLKIKEDFLKADEKEGFEEKRQIGENDEAICQIIRDDSIDEFKKFVDEQKISLDSLIKDSIYETNSFLKKRKSKIIEYAAFFGSMKILNFLKENEVELTSSLWQYGIHGNSIELIKFLDENEVELPNKKSNNECLSVCIKCHHNEIYDYIQKKYFLNREISNFVFSKSIRYFNFVLVQDELINMKSFYEMCQYDYYPIVDFLSKSADIKEIDILNKKIFFLFNSKINSF